MRFYKLCDFKGEDEAWAIVANIIEPLAEIATDEKVKAELKGDRMKLAKLIVETHKQSATKILALLAKQDYETFKKEITPAAIAIGVMTALNDTELIDLFQSQGLTTDEN